MNLFMKAMINILAEGLEMGWYGPRHLISSTCAAFISGQAGDRGTERSMSHLLLLESYCVAHGLQH